jgi:hypothetical protein
VDVNVDINGVADVAGTILVNVGLKTMSVGIGVGGFGEVGGIRVG